MQLTQFALRSLVHCWQLVSVCKSFITRLYKLKDIPIISFIDCLIDLIVVPSLLFLKVFRFPDRISNVQINA